MKNMLYALILIIIQHFYIVTRADWMLFLGLSPTFWLLKHSQTHYNFYTMYLMFTQFF